MQFFGIDLVGNLGIILIAGAGIALYIASRSAADALTHSKAVSPGWLAIGQWLPIAAVSMMAMVLNRPTIAIGVIFATSVACLSLATGAVAFLHPPAAVTVIRKAWPMILPAALLVFIAGFRGELTVLHGVVLGFEGIIVLFLWNDQKREQPAAAKFNIFRAIQFLLAVGLMCIGAWAAVRGADRTSHSTEIAFARIDVASTGLLAATLLSPLLVLPILGAGVDLAHREQTWTAITSQVGVALLNVCALVPMVIAISYTRGFLLRLYPDSEKLRHFFHVESTPVIDTIQFPIAAWRVDVVVLIVLGLFLLPVAAGRWTLTKYDGAILIAGYAAYLILAMAIGARAM